MLQRGGDSFGVLDCEMSVMQEHLDSSRYFWVSEFIYGRKNPGCLNEDQIRYLRAFANE